MRINDIDGKEVMPWLTKQGRAYWNSEGQKVDWQGKPWRDPVKLTEEDIEKFDLYVEHHLAKKLWLSCELTGRDTVWQRVKINLNIGNNTVKSTDFNYPVKC